MDYATKNSHLNENRAFCYSVLSNISLRNKDRSCKSSAEQILSELFVWLFLGGNMPVTQRDGLMLSLLTVGFILLQY